MKKQFEGRNMTVWLEGEYDDPVTDVIVRSNDLRKQIITEQSRLISLLMGELGRASARAGARIIPKSAIKKPVFKRAPARLGVVNSIGIPLRRKVKKTSKKARVTGGKSTPVIIQDHVE